MKKEADMKKEKWYHVAGFFFRQYFPVFLMFFVCAGIFAAIFTLYDLEAEAVFYAAGLCLMLLAVVVAVFFWQYKKKHDERQQILKNIQLLADGLPKAATLEESDYQEMLLALKDILDTNLTAWKNEQQERMDYYTTWVHQIKTPISVMRMILQGEDTDEHRALAAELFRIEQYVGMVLGYLRLGSDSSDYIFQTYALDGIIKQAIHKYAPQFVRKRIRLIYEPTDVYVLTDEKWLLFIIEQILSNAIKYTPEGTVSVTVTPDKVLKIADTGIGIAPEDIPRIFEKGFTGYNGRADKKSTGLGLYLCRMAAGRLSHTISVTSVPGEGTVFSVDLHTDKLEVE